MSKNGQEKSAKSATKSFYGMALQDGGLSGAIANNPKLKESLQGLGDKLNTFNWGNKTNGANLKEFANALKEISAQNPGLQEQVFKLTEDYFKQVAGFKEKIGEYKGRFQEVRLEARANVRNANSKLEQLGKAQDDKKIVLKTPQLNDVELAGTIVGKALREASKVSATKVATPAPVATKKEQSATKSFYGMVLQDGGLSGAIANNSKLKESLQGLGDKLNTFNWGNKTNAANLKEFANALKEISAQNPGLQEQVFKLTEDYFKQVAGFKEKIGEYKGRFQEVRLEARANVRNANGKAAQQLATKAAVLDENKPSQQEATRSVVDDKKVGLEQVSMHQTFDHPLMNEMNKPKPLSPNVSLRQAETSAVRVPAATESLKSASVDAPDPKTTEPFGAWLFKKTPVAKEIEMVNISKASNIRQSFGSATLQKEASLNTVRNPKKKGSGKGRGA